MMQTLRTAAIAAATATVAGTGAPPAAAQQIVELPEIVVSGGLTPIAADAYGRAASIVTRQQIEARGIATVREALRSLPGVAVSTANASFSEIRIRGAEASHTLILIDGIEAAGGDAEYALSNLDTAQVERIEVLRGPQSVYYGSNASAGVVNIITRSGAEGTRYGFALEAGEAAAASGFVSQRGPRGGLSFSLSHRRDRGYDFSGSGGERDETARTTYIVAGDWLAMPALRLGATLRLSDERYDYDANSFTATDADSYVVDDPALTATRDETMLGVFAEYEMLGGRLLHRLAYELTENVQDFSAGSRTVLRTEALKYRLSLGLDGRAAASADHLLNVMLERETDSSSSDPAYDRAANSLALEYRGRIAGALDLQAGVRHDFNDVFEDATTWNLGAAWMLAGGVRLHASAGSGVVNPTYFELYADAFGYTGNPGLRPERNRGYDLGVEVPFWGGRGVIDVTYFNETLADEITPVATGTGLSFANQSGDSDRQGVELAADLAASDRLDLRLTYTWLDATDPDGSREIRRPQHELGLGATWTSAGGRTALSADLRHVAGNRDTQFWGAYRTVELPDYTTVDVAARHALTEALTLTARVENLLDAETMDQWGYAGRGRAAYVGLDARW